MLSYHRMSLENQIRSEFPLDWPSRYVSTSQVTMNEYSGNCEIVLGTNENKVPLTR